MLRVSIAFIRDLADPFWIGSPIQYKTGSLVKVIQFRTEPFQAGTAPV